MNEKSWEEREKEKKIEIGFLGSRSPVTIGVHHDRWWLEMESSWISTCHDGGILNFTTGFWISTPYARYSIKFK